MLDVGKFATKMYDAGYIQKTFAKAINISENALSRILNGEKNLDTEQVKKCCALLDITTDREKIDIFLK